MEKLYDVNEAARQLQVSVGAVRRWVYEGKINHKKIGKFVRFTQDDIDSFVIRRDSEKLARKRGRHFDDSPFSLR